MQLLQDSPCLKRASNGGGPQDWGCRWCRHQAGTAEARGKLLWCSGGRETGQAWVPTDATLVAWNDRIRLNLRRGWSYGKWGVCSIDVQVSGSESIDGHIVGSLWQPETMMLGSAVEDKVWPVLRALQWQAHGITLDEDMGGREQVWALESGLYGRCLLQYWMNGRSGIGKHVVRHWEGGCARQVQGRAIEELRHGAPELLLQGGAQAVKKGQAFSPGNGWVSSMRGCFELAMEALHDTVSHRVIRGGVDALCT